MEKSNGSLYFNAGIDLTKLSEDARSAKDMLRSISTEAIKNGDVLDNAFAGTALTGLAGTIAKVSDRIKEMGFETLEEKISGLSAVIKDSENVILGLNEKIRLLKEEAQEAFESGDTDTFNKLTSEILRTGEQIQELIKETHEYADALDAVRGLSGMQSGAAEPLRLYDSEADLREVQSLQEEISRLKSAMLTADGAELSALQSQLQSATSRMKALNDSAAETAVRLGNDLASRASEAQQTLAALNQEIDRQQSVLSGLEEKFDAAKSRLEALNETEGATKDELDRATASMEFYGNAIDEAKNRLSLLQGAQTDAIGEWNRLSGEIQSHDSIMVRMMGGYENYTTVLSHLPAPLQSVITGITGMTGAAKAFIATPLGAIISAIVIALQALYTWFNSSVEGQMAFARISGYVSGVLGQLKEIVIAVGKAIYKAFSNPKEAVKNLWESIKTNILNRLKAVANMFKDLGKIISSALDLDWDGVKSGLSSLKDDFIQVNTGVENLTDKIADWAAGVHAAAKATSEIAVAGKELEIQASEWQKRSAELDKQKAQAMAKIYDTSLSAEEREKAMKAYKAALTEQTETELKLQRKRIEHQERSMALTTNSIEDENKLRDLQAQGIQIEARHEQQLAMLQRRQNSLNSSRSQAASKADSAAVRQASAKMNMTEYERNTIEKERELALAMEQARVDGMKEGLTKTLAQNRLNWQKLRDDNIKRAESYVKEYRAKLFQDYMIENPNASKGQQAKYKLFIETEINADNLPETLKNILKDYERVADEAFERSNRESLDNALQDVLTYEQQRTKIAEEYARKREALYEKNADGSTKTDTDGNPVFRKGVTRGNLDELNRQETEALKAIDEQFAQREETYQAWCEEISDLSLRKLEEVLENAKKRLEELENSGSKDGKALAQARAKVATAQKAVNKEHAKNQTNPGKRTLKEWEDLYKTLNDVEKEFESIGETVGGVIGDIISECGQFATSTLQMINGIVQLTQTSKTGIEETGKSCATALSTMEKASVILTVISAAMQIAIQIANLFNSDNRKQKEIEALQTRIDQLQWELDNQGIVRAESLLQTGSYIGEVNKALTATEKAVYRVYSCSRQEWGFKRASEDADRMRETVEQLSKSYVKMGYAADKALGEEKYRGTRENLEKIAEQQILLQEQADIERSKKKSDEDTVRDIEENIEELGQKALDLINDLVEDIIGDTSNGIAEQLSDAFLEAFAAGEDAAEAWGDKVNDIVADIIKRMFVSQFLEKPLGEIFNKYKAKWFPDGEFAGTQAVVDSMTDFADDVNGLRDGYATVIESLPEDLKKFFLGDDADREASQKGIATASQESVDELNGRATAIQGHTYSIMENTKILVANTNAILTSVMNIEAETEGFNDRLSRMESNLKEANDNLSDIVTKGIRLKN